MRIHATLLHSLLILNSIWFFSLILLLLFLIYALFLSSSRAIWVEILPEIGELSSGLISWNSDGDIPGISSIQYLDYGELLKKWDSLLPFITSQAQPEINCLYFFPATSRKDTRKEPFLEGKMAKRREEPSVGHRLIGWLGTHVSPAPSTPFRSMARILFAI